MRFKVSCATRYCVILILAAQIAACAKLEVQVSGFRPVNPPVTAGSSFVLALDWPTVSTLQPTLQWQPVPGEHHEPWNFDAQPFITADLERITNVSYDLRIWLVRDDWPVELVYEREAIEDTTHRLEAPLEPLSKYFWSVRARFDLDGETRVSEWSLTLFPQGDLDDPREVSRKTGEIPLANYYRFQTPEAGSAETETAVVKYDKQRVAQDGPWAGKLQLADRDFALEVWCEGSRRIGGVTSGVLGEDGRIPTTTIGLADDRITLSGTINRVEVVNRRNYWCPHGTLNFE